MVTFFSGIASGCPSMGIFCQCGGGTSWPAAYEVGGSGPAGITGIYQKSGAFGGKPFYEHENNPGPGDDYSLRWNEAYQGWEIGVGVPPTHFPGPPVHDTNAPAALPDDPGWFQLTVTQQ